MNYIDGRKHGAGSDSPSNVLELDKPVPLLR